jgi:hypothetical protein
MFVELEVSPEIRFAFTNKRFEMKCEINLKLFKSNFVFKLHSGNH